MATRPKRVCIIGAGPSGIVAAKTMLHDYPKDTFHVTIFEQLPRIGGLWPISKKDDGMVNPDMCTNQSRHTVSFSGLAWAEDVPSFPKAWQVGEYLLKYLRMYPCEDVRLNSKVIKTELYDGKWEVYVQDETQGEEIESKYEFDHVLVATGFFGKPNIPEAFKNIKYRTRHTSEFRYVKDLLADGGKNTITKGRKIYVVGGQMSGVEVAGSVAYQLSSAAHSPGKSDLPGASEYIVHHVVQTPLWIMPLFLPKNPASEVNTAGGQQIKKRNSAPLFLPCDLVTYNLGWKPPGTLSNTSGHITPEAAMMTHDFMESYLGSDQSELERPELVMSGDVRSNPTYLAVSDHYTEFVRSGNIQTSKGKVSRSSMTLDQLVIKNGDQEGSLDDIAAIILATGFDANPSLDFLSEEVLRDLQFDSTRDDFPLALNVNTTVNHAIPSLGFVGFYRSPYWGVMEMQARFIGKLWSGDGKAAEALAEDKTMEAMLKLRGDPRRAQFPMGDYAYLMESFSDILGIKRFEPEGTPAAARTGIVLPARYIFDNASVEEQHEVHKELSIVDNIFSDSERRGKFITRAIFRAMQGDWKLERRITSKISMYPSGTLSGTAKFLPRDPTNEGYDMEHLYLEQGDFKTETGLNFVAKRSYAHRYREDTDTLSVWFTKDDKSVDYLFHELEIVPLAEGNGDHSDEPWRAKSSHLCIDDTYDVEYEFWFDGVQLKEWTMEYNVKGPQKDYRIRSTFRR